MKTKELTIEQFTPLWDNIIVKPIKLEAKDQFKRPQQEDDKSELGEVMAVGLGTDTVDVSKYIKVGDIVLFNKYSSTAIDLGKPLIVRAEDVVAVLKK